MAYLSLTFTDYQTQYENPIIPVPVQKTFSQLKSKFHDVATVVDQWNQVPDIIVKVAQFVSGLFSLIPLFEPFAAVPKQFSKEAKIFTNLVKGFRSIDNLLHLSVAWKAIVMQASTLTIFAVSILAFADRYALFELTAIKVMLASIPIFGILPYGGVLTLALAALFGTMFLFALEKKKKLDLDEKTLNQNAAFWSQTFDESKVDQRLEKYEKITQELQKEVDHYETLITEGENKEADLIAQNAWSYQRYACQKAIDHIKAVRDLKQKELRKYEDKSDNWKQLKTEWLTLDQAAIEDYRQAKEEKWALKLDRLHYEKKSNFISMGTSAFMFSRQILTIGTALSKGASVPFAVNATLELIGAAGDITNFIRKRGLLNYKIPSVDMADFIPLDQPRVENHSG